MSHAAQRNTAHVETMLYGGEGRARTSDGSTLQVAFTLPDEEIAVPATPLTILKPSPDRVSARCVHFGICGGCHYQHADYPAQLAIKRSVVDDIFCHASLTDLPEIVVHAAEPWHYRNRIRLRIAKVDGVLRLGYSRPAPSGATDAFLPIEMCPIAAPLLWRAAEALIELPLTDTGQAETIARWLAAAVEVELFTTAEEDVLQMTLYVRSDVGRSFGQSFESLAKALQQAIPQLTGAGVAILPKASTERSRRMERPRPGPQWGTPGLLYRVAAADVAKAKPYWVSRGSFFQVNRHLVATLERLVLANRSGSLAWDLYGGVGLFSRALAASFSHVVAVEVAESAVTDLAQNLRSTASRVMAQTTLDFLKSAVIDRARPDLIVMDPPRAGVGAEVCALLARVQAPVLVYVSCDPVTLARDLKLLTASGYAVTELNLVDMFPQTFHIETVAILTRQTA